MYHCRGGLFTCSHVLVVVVVVDSQLALKNPLVVDLLCQSGVLKCVVLHFIITLSDV